MRAALLRGCEGEVLLEHGEDCGEVRGPDLGLVRGEDGRDEFKTPCVTSHLALALIPCKSFFFFFHGGGHRFFPAWAGTVTSWTMDHSM